MCRHYSIRVTVYVSALMPVDLATGQGLLTIPKFGANVTRVVLIVSA